MTTSNAVVELFLVGASTVAEAIADPAVSSSWELPSVLEDQLVSGLVGHLARGGVWVVGEYLEAAAPEDQNLQFECAADYISGFASRSRPEDHAAVRQRGAEVGAMGHERVLETVTERLSVLSSLLSGLSDDRRIAVMGGAVMRLGDYLRTRIVEQAVHLDDLARSVGHSPWPLPDDHVRTALAVGMEVARQSHGSDAVLRVVFRQGFADEVLPVL